MYHFISTVSKYINNKKVTVCAIVMLINVNYTDK